MIINKVIEIGIDIKDCVAAVTEFRQNILRILTDRFVGRCLRMCYVQKIVRVLALSPLTISSDGAPDFGTVCVQFEVSAIVYVPGEIINGCRVVSKEALRGISDTIICSTEHADIQLNNIPLIESVRNDQLISVRVGEAKYTLGSPRVAINATALVLSKVPTVFKFSPALFPADFADFIEGFFDKFEELRARADSLRAKNQQAWAVFEKMLYAYDTPQRAPSGAETVAILDLIRNPPARECYLSRDPRVSPTSGDAYMYESEGVMRAATAATHAQIVDNVTAHTVLVSLLDDYYNMLRTVVEYVDIYSTQELLNSHRNLWLIFNAMKKQNPTAPADEP